MDAELARENIKDEISAARRETSHVALGSLIGVAAIGFLAAEQVTMDTVIICAVIAVATSTLHRVLTGIRIDGLRQEMHALPHSDRH